MSFNFRLAPHMTKIPSNPIFHLLPKLNEPGFISFAPGAPASDSFPSEDISEILNTILAQNPAEILQYGSTEGYPPARRAMAKIISKYGLSPEPSDIIMTTGGQQALDILTSIFIEPGDVALVEAPTYSATLQILKSHRAQAVALESDENGFLPDDLESKIKIFHPKFVYLIPTFKNPSGATISLERRAAAAEITGRYGVPLIEDDPYRDLRYRGEHLPTIKSFDKEDNVIFVTSTSKILCPGLRVGAAYVPKALAPVMTIAKQTADMHSSTLPQAIVSEYVERGLLGPHIERVCADYGKKLDIMQKSITEFFPENIDTTNPQGGLFVWCACPGPVDADDLLNRAIEKKVAFIPGGQFFTDGRGQNTFRLNFSNADCNDIIKGMEILGKILHAKN